MQSTMEMIRRRIDNKLVAVVIKCELAFMNTICTAANHSTKVCTILLVFCHTEENSSSPISHC